MSIINSTKQNLFNSSGHPASRAAPDVPKCESKHGIKLTEMVKDVVKTWKVLDLEDMKKVGIIIPPDQDHREVMKSRFVNLLEYCEDELGLKEVIAVFERTDLTTTSGFPRTLKYVGFRAIAPERLPLPLDPATHFAMTYVV